MAERSTNGGWRRGGCAAALLLAVLCRPAPAGAELVVLDDGRFFKVTAYEAAAGSARLTLAEGGRVVLPLDRVAHVVDDEWVPPPEPEPETTAAAPGAR
ncbi:MAG TPA: hypothetical protein VLF66_04810, partial [Thermoanaerobaculia bacterium]|nr:hypothetical protein [Thermoanaerobaculia bacterium]